MKQTLLLVGAVVVLLGFSCSNNKASSGVESGNVTEEKNSNEKQSATKSEIKISNCLKNHENNYSDLLTEEDIRKHYSGDLDGVKLNDNGGGSYGSVYYTWDSSRPAVKMKDFPMAIPDNNSIGLKMLSFNDDASVSTIDNFAMGYKQLSEEELAQINANIEKTYRGDAVKIEENKKTMQARQANSYELVEDLGTRAYWRWGAQNGGELAILIGKAKFTVITKVSENPSENLALAKKIAREVINKCN